ncbi:tyrosine--tRNA ligase, cytoplasmic-like [Macadamia integrifolia]|uniref:tyrosine--tRNA ligase, cytoplasmic-like n=1 Tax=Macadamia integrifolia TaxID=60698 RepID=UPI001C4FDE64|nr:tyrosine--tRNA ligase, cytoplasmic-like [Macadamia integrifolia]
MAAALKCGALLLSSKSFCPYQSTLTAPSFFGNLLLRKSFPPPLIFSNRCFFRSSLKASDADFNLTTSPPKPDSSADPPPSEPSIPQSEPIKSLVDALDIRVGRILKAWRHPEADSLYVEEVDVGEPEPRTICSGLVNYIPLDHIQGLQVIVLANLKPRNMRGIKSSGMLLAASDASHENVELLLPPEGSVPGERIWFGTEEEKEGQGDPSSANQIQKKKVWETVQPRLKTNESCIAALVVDEGQGLHPMRTSAGLVVCPSLKNARIS